ncbi:MAG: NADH-quinone oxidoreductase subunit J [Planctomycetaceae bacterium]|nr:NADH-quinone oxidoreductase subunit J [Planctomycetaceae bacterium]
MEWFQKNPLALAGLVAWIVGILMLMPGRKATSVRIPRLGLLVTAAGVVLFCAGVGGRGPEFANEVMFWTFAVGALLCGVLMITARNPVYGALWFALSTLSTCGLFLLQSAPFLAAATVIVYAGAVIVTFLFVIMLAQQSGAAAYDHRSRNAIPVTLASFVLLGAITLTLHKSPPAFSKRDLKEEAKVEVAAAAPPTGMMMVSPDNLPKEKPASKPNQLSLETAKLPVGSMKGLGKSLFGDYLFAVELAGTLLLVACIGAIAIAPRREEGAL